jgi:drug/metabolite transporter (DMT)-like permease
MSSSASASERWRLPLALFSVYVVWGSTYLAMRFALEGFPPLLMAATRFTIAGGLLLIFLAARGVPLPDRRQWLRALPIGALLFAIGNGFVALGERDIGSGLAAVIVATMPLWMTVIVAATGERPGPREVLGIVFGIGGVVILASEGELRGAPLATLLLFLAPLSWALGSVLARRLDQPRGPMAAAAQMLVGGLLAGAAGLATGERITAVPSTDALLAILYLITFGSWVAFLAYAWLLHHASPALSTSYAYVNPLIAVALGALLGAERFGWQTAAAAPLIVLAVALVVTGRSPGRRRKPVDDAGSPPG